MSISKAAISVGLAFSLLAASAHASAQNGDGQPSPPPNPPAPPSLLVLLAHPDDEITLAPVLSRFARSGADVTLLFATSGDAGPGVTTMEPGAELAKLREDEARCAAFALGLPEPQFWRLGDGTLGQTPRAPDSPARDLIGRIDAAITEAKAPIIMTWGPDGGYGHGDHRMMSSATTQVVQSLPEEGRPDLMYVAIPAGERAALPEFEQWATTHPSLITDKIRYQPQDLQATREAMACYESQFTEEARAGLPDLLHNMVWQGAVRFRLAFPAPMRPPERP